MGFFDTLCRVMFYFMIYSVVGWIYETTLCSITDRRFVNRGFLNGPYCPIYGSGALLDVLVLGRIENPFLLFILGVLVTCSLEYLTSYVIEKLFKARWWDYSDKPFNIHGYVCLKFSIYWGLACTFIMDVLHPIIYKGITLMPHIVGMILICIIMTVFFVDCGITVATILKFNKRLKVMDEMAERIHKLSDEIGENIYENVTEIVEKSGEFQETHAELLDKLAETTGAAKDKIAETTGTAKNKITGTTETAREKIAETTGNAKEKITDTAANAKLAISENIMEAKSSFEAKKNAWTEKSEEWKKNREKQKAELSELSEKYEHLFEEKNFGFQRLMKAFPDMKSRENDKTLTEFKKHFRLDKPEQK